MKSFVSTTVVTMLYQCMPLAPKHNGTDKFDLPNKFMHEQKMRNVRRIEEEIESEVHKLYALVLGQCTDTLKARIDKHPDFAIMSDEQNRIPLLSSIKVISFPLQSAGVLQINDAEHHIPVAYL